MGISWLDCSSDLFELIADEYNMVSCYTINHGGHRNYPANIAKITFKGQDLPNSVYIDGAFCKVKPYIPPPLHPVNVKTTRDMDTQQNTVDAPHVALFVPHLAISIHAYRRHHLCIHGLEDLVL